MIHRAELTITEGDSDRPSTMVSCEVEFDREAKKWRAFDEVGNVVFHDWKAIAIARCLALRLCPEASREMRIIDAAMKVGEHWRNQDGINAAFLDELEEVTRPT